MKDRNNCKPTKKQKRKWKITGERQDKHHFQSNGGPMPFSWGHNFRYVERVK